MNWEGRPCVSRGSDCLCQTYGRIALFQAESPNLGDAPNIISEEEEGFPR
ncbi:Hypothetical protein FKW44_016738 [Caligus rogercresseyi]|uniref:Uncharacterized protein n=1 Tax=Caligus rogercresseyi TaxID=217165 RepID=A0A7T8K1D6_CALRO|nr:Hypothetical protein FKW44_016738 [Caligus rogercresseyi]